MSESIQIATAQNHCCSTPPHTTVLNHLVLHTQVVNYNWPLSPLPAASCEGHIVFGLFTCCVLSLPRSHFICIPSFTGAVSLQVHYVFKSSYCSSNAVLVRADSGDPWATEQSLTYAAIVQGCQGMLLLLLSFSLDHFYWIWFNCLCFSSLSFH